MVKTQIYIGPDPYQKGTLVNVTRDYVCCQWKLPGVTPTHAPLGVPVKTSDKSCGQTFKSEVGSVQPHSLCKYRSHAQIQIRVVPPYAGRAEVANRIQPPTFEGIHLVPNLGQPVTQTAIRGRRGGARTDRKCGGVDPRKLHGRSRQQGSRRRCL